MADRVLIIAEAGVNHNGSVDRALEMVDIAADAGADMIKFQSFKAEELVTGDAAKADYQLTNTGAGSQLEMLRELELGEDQHKALVDKCRVRGIGFLSTAFDMGSLAFLASLDMPMVKIPSGDITFAPMLLAAARLRRPLIVSTGMSSLADVEAALGVIAFGLLSEKEPGGRDDFVRAFASAQGRAALARNVTLLHCVSQYPALPETVNLRAMETLARAFHLPVGYSDHTLGIEVSVAAAALGAAIIEKHFTLDRKLPGPDHVASLEPDQLRAMVASIRTVERALGSGIKAPADGEWNARKVARRSLVAARPIRKGETISADMLAAKRPGDGLSPLDLWSLVGRVADRDYAADEKILPCPCQLSS